MTPQTIDQLVKRVALIEVAVRTVRSDRGFDNVLLARAKVAMADFDLFWHTFEATLTSTEHAALLQRAEFVRRIIAAIEIDQQTAALRWGIDSAQGRPRLCAVGAVAAGVAATRLAA